MTDAAENVEPEALTGYPEAQLDAVDASVFSGDCYYSAAGKARIAWYMARWTKALELEPVCVWEEVEAGIYNTCGEEFHLTEGLELWPQCHHCGGKIEVRP